METRLSLNSLFMSGMVLQQNTTNCISGICNPAERIELKFRGKTYGTKSDKRGFWNVKLAPETAGGPYEMDIKCSTGEELKLKDIYFGEVWLCSGQSNMQLPMERLAYSFPKDITAPVNENIRVYTVPITYSFDGEKKNCPPAVWNAVGPETLPAISGTSYFFAKKLYSDLKVPVGIINASQGGSPLASWIDAKTARKWPDYAKRLDECLDPAAVEEKKKLFEQKNNEWLAKCASADLGISQKWESAEAVKTGGWKNIEIPFTHNYEQAGAVWLKKTFTLSAKDIEILRKNKIHLWLGTIVHSDTTFVNGTQVGFTPYEYPPRRYEISASLLHEGENEITVRAVHAWSLLKFESEKPYCIFTDNVNVKPIFPGNYIGTKNGETLGEDAFYLDLKGTWRIKEGCSVENAPGNFFPEWQPTALYNNMLAPCFQMAVRGFLWYQGESDVQGNPYYEKQLSQMIQLWRKKFTYAADKNAPFIIIQLPNFGERNDIPDYCEWPLTREAQFNASMKNKNCGLAVTIDCGDWNDLHPEDKETVGTRAALEAERLAYGRKIESSPYATGIKATADGAIVEFSREITIDSGNMPVISGVLCKKNKPDIIVQLMIKVAAHKNLIVMMPEEQMRLNYKIKEVRYNWTDSPKSPSMYDKKNILPVVPFRISL